MVDEALASLANLRKNPASAFAVLEQVSVERALFNGIRLEDLGSNLDEWKRLTRSLRIKAFRGRITKARVNPQQLASVVEFFQDAVKSWDIAIGALLEGLDQELVYLLITGLMDRSS